MTKRYASKSVMDHLKLKRAMIKALANGATHPTLSKVEWNTAGNCTDPVFIERHAHPPFGGTFLQMEQLTRCLKCEACREARSFHWTRRAEVECRRNARTWFGSLTIRPEERLHALSQARAEYSNSGDFDTLDYKLQFLRVVSVLQREVTRYQSRIRKASTGKLRILLVTEQHKTGDPHFHMLVHECEANGPTPEEMEGLLRREWKLGFCDWSVIRTHSGAARYACKYIGKSGASRIRASIGYGKPLVDVANAC